MRKTLKRRTGAAPKKFQRGGRVEDDSDRPEERGPVGLRYNRLLKALRDTQEMEREADRYRGTDGQAWWARNELLRLPEEEVRAMSPNERAAYRAAEAQERYQSRKGLAQRMQRRVERDLEAEGRRIGAAPRYSSGRMEDAGFKKGGKISSPKAKKFQAGGPVMGQQVGGGSLPPRMPNGTTAPSPPGGYSGPNPNAVAFTPGSGTAGSPTSKPPSMGQGTSPSRPSMGVGGGSQPPAPPSGPRPGAEPNMPRGGMSPERMQMMRDRVQAMRDRMQAMRQAMAQRRGGAAPAVMKKGGKVVAKKAGGMIKAKGSK